MNEKRKARMIAFYLPQFHPIPENDEWWGKGFTEWTNVGKAKPLFRGHYQPRIPADLGYYDLRLPEVREAQAEMARYAGIEGFCYWHYWFGNGKRLLERPFNEVLESGKPDFPFCLGWANHSWTSKTWEKGTSRVRDAMLMEQVYSEEDYIIHFQEVLKAFKDPRYITVDGKPLFLIYDPLGIPDAASFIKIWRDLASDNGLAGIHFVGTAYSARLRNSKTGKLKFKQTSEEGKNNYNEILNMGFDAVNSRGYVRASMMAHGVIKRYIAIAVKKMLKGQKLTRYEYEKIIKFMFIPEDNWGNVYPTLLSNFDRTARAGKKADVYHNSTPELFAKHLADGLEKLKQKNDQHRILFLQSWNEWAEGNYVEPDLKFGRKYLEVLRNYLA